MCFVLLHCILIDFFSFFLTSLLEYNCFTMMCQFLLYNKVNQLYVYIYPHIPSLLRLPPTLPIPPLQVVTKHRADLPVLRGCFPLASYFTFGSVYMSVPLSHVVSAYPSPSLCPRVHSLRLRLYSCPAPRFQSLGRLDTYFSCTSVLLICSWLLNISIRLGTEKNGTGIVKFSERATEDSNLISILHLEEDRPSARGWQTTAHRPNGPAAYFCK